MPLANSVEADVGDTVARAWNAYKSCKDAPPSFSGLSDEALSLHIVLKNAQETLFARPLSGDRQAGLAAVLTGCQNVLSRLEDVVERYESRGIRGRRVWDPLPWDMEEVASIRASAKSHVGMLTALISTSQIRLEKKLDDFMKELRSEKREGSAISGQTLDSLSADDRIAWREIRKELEDIGITIAAFDANRDFIFEWFSNAIKSGNLGEKHQDGEVHLKQDDGFDAATDGAGTDSSWKDFQKSERPVELRAKVHQTENIPKFWERMSQILKARNFRYALRNRLEVQQKHAFFNAIARQDNSTAVRILNDRTSIDAFSEHILKDALVQICQKMFTGDWLSSGVPRKPLKEADLYHGDCLVRDILTKFSNLQCLADYILHDSSIEISLKDKLTTIAVEQNWQLAFEILDPDVNALFSNGTSGTLTLLQMAVSAGSARTARFLIEKGAEMDYCTEDHGTALMIAMRGWRNEVAQVLVDGGAKVSFRAPHGYGSMMERTAVETAVYQRNTDGLIILLEKDARASTLSTLKFALNCSYNCARFLGKKWGMKVNSEILTILAKTDPRHVHYFKDDGTSVEDKVERMLEDLS